MVDGPAFIVALLVDWPTSLSDVAFLVRYEGTTDGAYEIVDLMRERGLKVEWVPPPQERAGVVEIILITIVARGSYDLLKAAVLEARQRLTSRGSVAIDEGRVGGQAETTNPDQK